MPYSQDEVEELARAAYRSGWKRAIGKQPDMWSALQERTIDSRFETWWKKNGRQD